MRYIALFIFSLIIFISCNGSGEGEQKDSAKTACTTKPLNPNGDSELALLMRAMAAFTDSTKQDLLNNRSIDPKPENFKTILTAKKTDESIDNSVFAPLASNYLARVDDFYAASPENKKEAFNDMVNSCIGCHQNFCHGPIKRIQKLLLVASDK